ncbi:MAG: hypothetical protein MUC40_00370 [Akkermansiaceae bacterium]|nr:hypothetical protein [Akkermansiaceae bacterium]
MSPTPQTYHLRKVSLNVRVELEAIHRNGLEIETPDELNESRQALYDAGWLSSTDTMFGSWLEIAPLALIGKPGSRHLRPNLDWSFRYVEPVGWILA